MNVPEDLQGLYNHCLDLASKDTERMPISPELLMAIIERVGDLETDSENLESYIHYECRKKLKKETDRAEGLTVDIAKFKQDIVDASMSAGIYTTALGEAVDGVKHGV
jgi:hypothetical protein